jgi:hypothetical protein
MRGRFGRVGVVVLLVTVVSMLLAAPAFAKKKPPTSTTTSTSTTSTTTSTTTTSTTTTSTTPTTSTSVPTTTTVAPSQVITGGFDISWPQCSKALPSNPTFGIVGVSNGLAFSDNPCLVAEYRWAAGASHAPSFYMSTANPGAQSIHWTEPGPKPCSGASDDRGCAYNYGWNAASHAFAYAAAQTGDAAQRMWWLDIETLNTWSTTVALNNDDIQGMVDFFAARSVPVGVYSTRFQWNQITGGLVLGVPNWLAGASSTSQAVSWCTTGTSFSGGRIAMVQYATSSIDTDVAC